MVRKFLFSIIIILMFFSVVSCDYDNEPDDQVKIIVNTKYDIDSSIPKKIEAWRIRKENDMPLYEVYKELKLIDVHSHDARAPLTAYWEQYGIDKTVLFGEISRPVAESTDNMTWDAYEAYPDIIYPSFAGMPLNVDKKGIDITKEKLEKGYLNIGELVAASTYSPSANNEWKAENPNWGNLPEIYDLAAKYKVPVLLHIDPPNGTPINFFKRALMDHPDTIFIFGHGNVYKTPESLKGLLAEYDNLYVDFFAGFTRYNVNSENTLDDFLPLMEEYPDRFFLGSDSGVEIGYTNSLNAMYEVIDKLSPETAAKVAYQNYERIIEMEPPTKTQIKKIKRLAIQLNIKNKTYKLNKRQANELIFDLEKKLEQTKK